MLLVPVGRLFCIVPFQMNQTDLNSIVKLRLTISVKFCTQISGNRCRVGTFEWNCMKYPLFRVPLIPGTLCSVYLLFLVPLDPCTPYSITSYSMYPLIRVPLTPLPLIPCTPYSVTPCSFTSWSGYARLM